MTQIGGKIDEMDRLQTRLRSDGEDLHRLQTELTSLVQNTWWVGPAAERFKNEFQGHSANLAKLGELLDQLGAEVRNRREALLNAGS